MRLTRRSRLFGWLGIGLIVLAWGAGSLVFGTFLFPPPWTVAADTAGSLLQAATWGQIAITLGRVLAGFCLAFAAGLGVGLLSGGRRELEAVFKPAILLLQGVPPMLWAIPLILILGVGGFSPVLAIALIGFPLVALTVTEGMRSVPRELAQMLQVFAPGFYPRLRELVLPHLTPFLAAALNLGLVLSIKSSVVAEFFGANDGIGFQIQAAYQAFQMRRLFVWGLVLVLLITLLDQALTRLKGIVERRTRGGRPPAGRWIVRRAPAPRAAGGTASNAESCLAAGPPSPGRIRLTGVGFSWPGEGERLLAGIDLGVEAEQVAVIHGESGVGKTTLLKLVAGLLPAACGRVEVPRRLGVVFQDDRFLPWRDARWNVALPLFYQGVERGRALAEADALLEEVGLAGEGDKLPAELSGGMKKRLAFARCFAGRSEALLLDEPFTGLHRDARRRLWERFFLLLARRPLPVLIVTHFPEEVPCSGRCSFYTLQGRPARLDPA